MDIYRKDYSSCFFPRRVVFSKLIYQSLTQTMSILLHPYRTVCHAVNLQDDYYGTPKSNIWDLNKKLDNSRQALHRHRMNISLLGLRTESALPQPCNSNNTGLKGKCWDAVSLFQIGQYSEIWQTWRSFFMFKLVIKKRHSLNNFPAMSMLGLRSLVENISWIQNFINS